MPPPFFYISLGTYPVVVFGWSLFFSLVALYTGVDSRESVHCGHGDGGQNIALFFFLSPTPQLIGGGVGVTERRC